MSPTNPSQDAVHHEVVLASAGSGKTYQLSLRIVKLLTLGAKPEEIVALTFTRAAAQEFASRTLRMLADGAASEKGAAKLSAEMKLSKPRNQAFFAQLLRQTLHHLHRLTLGTLDSFFARLVNNHPTEVGLHSTAPWTMEELEGASARREVLLAMLREADSTGLHKLGEQIRDLSVGKDAAMPFEMLEDHTGKLHDLLTLTNEQTTWGKIAAIWGTRPEIFTKPSSDAVAKALKTFTEWIDGNEHGFTPKRLDLFRAIMRAHAIALANSSEQMPAANHLTRISETDQMGAVTRGKSGVAQETKYYQAVPVSAEACDAYRVLARNALSLLLDLKIKETAALQNFLENFEAKYAVQVRTQGNLTFSDYVTLLLRADLAKKIDINYRLDCQVRHWLFDEFQDTSTRQWKVLAENLEEVLQDASGESTAFFVGDLKQSLYGWRAGNPKLLANIRELMITRFPGIEVESSLLKTRRCAQPVVDLVNRVLGNIEPVGDFFSPEAAQRWAKFFTKHETAKAERPEEGDALWVRLPESDDGDMVASQAIWIAGHLKDGGLIDETTGLLKPGITCAILVNKNDQAAKIAELLRILKIQAADEGETPVAEDNPLTAGLVALVRCTAHPTDKLSKGIVEMSVTASAALTRLGGWKTAGEKLAVIFQEDGAEGLVREICKGIELTEKDNANDFLRKRLAQLLAIAVSYDETGERKLDGFCHHLTGTSLRDSADPRSVQVLTVHRSKGLQYTCVYLPCLNNPTKLAAVRDELPIVHSNDAFDPEWILSRPNTAVVEAEDDSGPLAREVAREKGDSGYESLCKLYVGMTRAERRVVLVTTELSDSITKAARTEDRHGKYDAAELIEHVLGSEEAPTPKPAKKKGEAKEAEAPVARVMVSIGSDTWIKNIAAPRKIERKAVTIPAFTPVSRPERLKPSGAGKEQKGRPWAPSQQVAAGKAFGSLVHDLMESLEWDVAAFETELKAKTAGTTDAILVAAQEQILACLAKPAVRAALSERPEGCLLWTERQASLMHEGKLMHAIFDRVHVVPGKEAVILDYKTNDKVTDEELAEIYQGQMSLYRSAVAKLCDIPENKVRCVLIHVRKGTVVEV
jgi:ATP-dependent exoDNAse (exonuclease V) beta subunit